MAPRKDLMRVLRQDAGYSARLGFGIALPQASAVPGPDRTTATETPPHSEPVRPETRSLAAAEASTENPGARLQSAGSQDLGSEAREEEGVCVNTDAASGTPDASRAPTARGQVVYVSVSLTTRQAALAETWASAAKCSIPFLIRRVAQALRGDLFADWERDGMPFVDEARGVRGKHPTSVTLTLRPEFAASLSARHDPLGILGLARVIGPAFRARFETAFNDALAKAIPQPGSKGDVN